jgi:hypothetical protein
MRFFTVVVFVLLAAERAKAQSLDIAGIELRIGQDASEAVRALNVYEVRFQDGSWFVSQKIDGKYRWYGNFAAQNGKISFISKGFPLADDYDAARVYTQASKELRRRGGTECQTREVEFTDDIIHQFETRCGLYKLTFHIPTRTSANENVMPGVSIQLRKTLP